MKYDEPKNSDQLPSKQKQNLINKAELHRKSTKAMMKHANHHSIKHISYMMMLIKDKKLGFKKAHVKTMLDVGK